jgi:uncharacterized repeat protein (TIGR03943 family)
VSDPTRRPSRLRRPDAAALLASVAGLTLWLSLTDGIYRYLRPSMRPWLIASGVFVAGLALASAVTAWRERRQASRTASTRASVVGWFLVVPLVIAISTDPGALGAFAVRQQAGAIYAAPNDFDLDTYLASHTTGGQAPALQFKQFLAAAGGASKDRDLLAGTTVRLTGFVVHDEGDVPGAFTLARLMVGCCAGDATAMLVSVRDYEGAPLSDDNWVEVTGRFDERLTSKQPQDRFAGPVPVLAMASLRHVDQPREPYEYPW